MDYIEEHGLRSSLSKAMKDVILNKPDDPESYLSQWFASTPGMNRAFVFIKPHANTTATQALVTKTFGERGVKILQEGELTAEQIDSKLLIDQHYYAIASKATLLQPKDLPVPAAKFKEAFGVEWGVALASGNVYNAMGACKHLGVDGIRLGEEWRKAGDKVVKFGGGFYCGLLTVDEKEPIYVFNAFFMSMRADFVAPGTSIHYYDVEFNPTSLSWANFRGEVLGPTDPCKAPADSLRGLIMSGWEALGLSAQPDTGHNGVHASASPFEGLAERMNWLGASASSDSFGKVLLAKGLPEELIKEWSVDPQVPGVGSLFDSMEDLDYKAVVAKSVSFVQASSVREFLKAWIQANNVATTTIDNVTMMAGGKAAVASLKAGGDSAQQQTIVLEAAGAGSGWTIVHAHPSIAGQSAL